MKNEHALKQLSGAMDQAFANETVDEFYLPHFGHPDHCADLGGVAVPVVATASIPVAAGLSPMHPEMDQSCVASQRDPRR